MQQRIFIDSTIPLKNGQVFDGQGKILSGAKKLCHIHEEEGVFVCDLNKEKISPKPMSQRGFLQPTNKAHSELFEEDTPLNLSIFPKNKPLYIKDFEMPFPNDRLTPDNSGRPEYGFYLDTNEIGHISPDQEIWGHGFWLWDWADTHNKLSIFDPKTGYVKIDNLETKITTPKVFGYKIGQRVWLENTKEGVTDAGDYCIDFPKNQVRFIPKNKENDFYLSLTDVCFDLENLQDVVIENCVITAFVVNAIRIKNCKNVIIRNCKIFNVGCTAIEVDHSQGIVVDNCEIFHTGNNGIKMVACGSRRTLTSGDCCIKNCHMYDIGCFCRTYAPPIQCVGVGFTIDNNVIHDCPHMAIQYTGNEIKITNNVIYRVLYETGDAGAIYSGRDMTFRGNEISDNLICLTGGVGFGTMGIYNDDGLSGTKMERNVFYKVQRAVFLGGGIDFKVKNNLFVSCNPAIDTDARLILHKDVLASHYLETNKNRFYSIETYDPEDTEQGLSAIDEPYISRYPELKKLHERFSSTKDLPKIFPNGEITDNVIFGKDLSFSWGLSGQDFFDNFVYKNNANVIYQEDIEKFVNKTQYEKYLLALKLENETAK